MADRDFNVLTTKWVEVTDATGTLQVVSPLDAIKDSGKIFRIVESSPLDLFAIHRFLLTLLYWQSGDSLQALRESLLGGSVPSAVINDLKNEESQFELFDVRKPFFQDIAVATSKKRLSAASLFGELATGTNVSHFHHSDDNKARLCLRCATLGLLRLVPWTQSGGAGKQPSIHGAPPIMAMAVGCNLAETLGLNLIAIPKVPLGKPQWSGQFNPAKHGKTLSLLTALTWNPRRVHLGGPDESGVCVKCGSASAPTVGPIVFEKNPNCGDSDAKNFQASWMDPAAFYNAKGATVKTTKELTASTGNDRRSLFEQTFGKKIEPAPSSLITAANPTHRDWLAVFPCTNPANNKSYDHRLERFAEFEGEAPRRHQAWETRVAWEAGDVRAFHSFADYSPNPTPGTREFVRAALKLDTDAWAILRDARRRSMNHSTAAFDIFSSLYWPLRSRYSGFPSRVAAWLFLKLAANARDGQRTQGNLEPWRQLRSQTNSATPTKAQYSRRPPPEQLLETELDAELQKALRTVSANVDWTGLCQFLDDVLTTP